MQSGAPVFDTDTIDSDFVTSTGSMRWLPGEFALYGMLAFIALAMPRLLRSRERTTSWMLLVPPTVVLVMAQHRSGFLALAGAMAATGIFLVGSRRVLAGAFKLGLALAVALFVFLAIFGSSYILDTLTRLQHTFDTTEGTASWRLLAWFDVWLGIAERPLGHGFSSWDFWFNWRNPLIGSHNGFLDLTYRVGVPGLVILLALPLAITLRTREALQKNDAAMVALPVTACACMFAWLGYAFFNVVLATPHMSIFFWILLGIAASATSHERKAAIELVEHGRRTTA
jgi:O-antigen ligase